LAVEKRQDIKGIISQVQDPDQDHIEKNIEIGIGINTGTEKKIVVIKKEVIEIKIEENMTIEEKRKIKKPVKEEEKIEDPWNYSKKEIKKN